jgi:hypothetical protein
MQIQSETISKKELANKAILYFFDFELVEP